MRTLQNNSSTLKTFKFTDNAFLPKKVIIPLTQENNVTFKAIVKPGDTVTEGQIIAVPSDRKISPVHSSIPGTVDEIFSVISADGRIQEAISIKLGGSFSYLGKKLQDKKWSSLATSTLQKKIIDGGILNTFLTNNPVSLGNQFDCKDSLIVRLFDEDFLRVSDSLLFKFFQERIREGAQITAAACGLKNIIYIVDDKSLNEKFSDYLDENPGTIPEHILKHRQKGTGSPKGLKNDLLYVASKYFRKNPDVTVSEDSLFVDSYTMLDVYNAVVLEIPVISRFIVISGNSLYTSCFVNVRLGISLRDLVSQLGGFAINPETIIINSKLLGLSVNNLDVPVTKSVKSVEFIAKTPVTDGNIYPCVSCGCCRKICPAGLSPDLLYNHAVRRALVDESILSTARLCNNCNLCNTVCQSRFPLSQMMAVLQQEINR